MRLLKNIWKALFSKTEQPFIILDTVVPLHIREIGKLYPILHTVAGNLAVGEIKRFEFTGHENTLRVGQAIKVDLERGVTCMWIHLGHNYFKLVMKA